MSRSVRMDYERYRTPTTLFQCYECATLTPTLPDASGVALCDQHQDKPAGLWTCTDSFGAGPAHPCGWTNTSADALCQRCGARAVDGYGFSI